MSIAAVVTRGYGGFGSIALVTTRGYTPGPEALDERNRGGWLSPEQVKRLERIGKEAKPDLGRRRRAAEARRAELEGLFDQVTGVLPPVVAAEVDEIVAPFAEAPSEESPITGPTPAEAIDWPALLADLAAVRQLSIALSQAHEEEALMLMMLA